MDRLYENETAKPATWATASLLMAMQDPKRGQPDAKAAKKAARADAKAADKPKPEAKAAAKPDDKGDDKPGPSAKVPADKKPLPAKPVDPTRTTAKETPESKATAPDKAAKAEDRNE